MDNKTWFDLLEEASAKYTERSNRLQAQLVDELRQLGKMTEDELRLRKEIGDVAQAVINGELTTDEAIARLDGFTARMVVKPDDPRQTRPSNREVKPL